MMGSVKQFLVLLTYLRQKNELKNKHYGFLLYQFQQSLSLRFLRSELCIIRIIVDDRACLELSSQQRLMFSSRRLCHSKNNNEAQSLNKPLNNGRSANGLISSREFSPEPERSERLGNPLRGELFITAGLLNAPGSNKGWIGFDGGEPGRPDLTGERERREVDAKGGE